jgi:dethiobiotin synthetase
MSETRRSNVVVVTGTDTGVGKTWVTGAIARALAGIGARVIAIKPVETGCGSMAREEEDGVRLASVTGQADPREALIRLQAPLAPVLAAEREGRTIDFDDLLIRIEGFAAKADIVLLEGVGGLLAPITWEWCLVDIAQALEARAIVVASDRSGSVNHALLTLGALELASVPVTDVVITSPEVPDASTGTNDAAIARLGGIARIRHAVRTTDPVVAGAAMREVAEALVAARAVGAYTMEPEPQGPPG